MINISRCVCPVYRAHLDFTAFIEDRALFLGRCFHAGALCISQLLYLLQKNLLSRLGHISVDMPVTTRVPREECEEIY